MIAHWEDHVGTGMPSGARVLRIRRRNGSETDVLDLGNWCWTGMNWHSHDVVAYLVAGEQPPSASEDQVAKPIIQASLTRSAILDTAREAVTKDRAATHGALESSFGQIAAIWSVRLGVTVTTAQVAIMMIDLKTVRGWGNPGHLDNWVDMAGYAACGGELAGGEA